ncbi:unnamed protein product [Amoebophrya sp. A25]|nr:unnamed protein product [Amoebophrya sp. A25]|eukprot:GSA25T00007865001.1
MSVHLVSALAESLQLSHAVKQEALQPGDHIYVYRLFFTYSHHGIVVAGRSGKSRQGSMQEAVKRQEVDEGSNNDRGNEGGGQAWSRGDDVYVVHFTMDGVKLDHIDDFIRGGVFTAFHPSNTTKISSTRDQGNDSISRGGSSRSVGEEVSKPIVVVQKEDMSLNDLLDVEEDVDNFASVGVTPAGPNSRREGSESNHAASTSTDTMLIAQARPERQSTLSADTATTSTPATNLIDEAFMGTTIRRVRYGASSLEALLKRSGTVNSRRASPWFVTVLRALSFCELQEHGAGCEKLEYDFLERNCELFCEFCKCGPSDDMMIEDEPSSSGEQKVGVSKREDDEMQITSSHMAASRPDEGGVTTDAEIKCKKTVLAGGVAEEGHNFVMVGSDDPHDQSASGKSLGTSSSTQASIAHPQRIHLVENSRPPGPRPEDDEASRDKALALQNARRRRRLRFREWRQRSQQTRTESIVKTGAYGIATMATVAAAATVGVEVVGLSMAMGMFSSAFNTSQRKQAIEDHEQDDIEMENNSSVAVPGTNSDQHLSEQSNTNEKQDNLQEQLQARQRPRGPTELQHGEEKTAPSDPEHHQGNEISDAVEDGFVLLSDANDLGNDLLKEVDEGHDYDEVTTTASSGTSSARTPGGTAQHQEETSPRTRHEGDEKNVASTSILVDAQMASSEETAQEAVVVTPADCLRNLWRSVEALEIFSYELNDLTSLEAVALCDILVEAVDSCEQQVEEMEFGSSTTAIVVSSNKLSTPGAARSSSTTTTVASRTSDQQQDEAGSSPLRATESEQESIAESKALAKLVMALRSFCEARRT